jgi:hypothetical protein
MSYRANQVTIINPEINFNCIYFKESIHHWALIKEKLLDDLLELDEIAYKRFLEIVKAEGLVDPIFINCSRSRPLRRDLHFTVSS